MQSELENACRYGDCDALIMLHKNIMHNKSTNILLDIRNNNEALFRLCYKNNHIGAALLLYDLSVRLNDPIDIHVLDEHPFKYACAHDNINFAKWLIKIGILCGTFVNINIDNEYPFRHCCQINNFIFAKWLHGISVNQKMPINIHAQNDCCFVSVCRYGNLEFMQWLYQLGIDNKVPFDLMYCDNLFLTMCCKSSNILAFKWLFDKINGESIENTKTCINNCFKTACLSGDTHIMKFLFDKSIEMNLCISAESIDLLFEQICINGNVIIAEWLYKKSSKNIDFSGLFYKCCEYGNLHVLVFLHNLCFVHQSEILLNEAFKICCQNGHKECALWLFEIDTQKQIVLHQDNDAIFWDACKSKLSDIAKMMYALCNTLNDPINLEPMIHSVIRHCCINDDIVCVKWLYTKACELGISVDIRYNNDSTFKFCCCHEYVEVALFLAEQRNEYSVTVDDDYMIINWFVREAWYDCAPHIIPHKMINILGFQLDKNDVPQTCTICGDELIEICKLKCNHFYCCSCFVEWYLKRDMKLKCAYCQQNFKHNQCTIMTDNLMLLNDHEPSKRIKCS